MPPDRRPVIADVALFYGERSGGIKTYLDAKAAWARAAGAVEHHVVVPGPRERHEGGRHELPSIRVAATNGYRLPLGVKRLAETLEAIGPDVVFLHDPFWGPVDVTRAAHRAGALVVAVHHGSVALDAAGLPGPDRVYRPLLRRWFHHAYRDVDAVMSVVDTEHDAGRRADLRLRLGLDPAFRPRPEAERGAHVLYVGRFAREKGVEALARAAEGWPLRCLGAGPLRDLLAERADVRPWVHSREELALEYARAGVVVMPGEHETFGLAALEAAACGARVVACETAPSAGPAGAATFAPGDVPGLRRAIARQANAPRDLAAAERIAGHHGWAAIFARELAELDAIARVVVAA